jgi:hypothetical protein
MSSLSGVVLLVLSTSCDTVSISTFIAGSRCQAEWGDLAGKKGSRTTRQRSDSTSTVIVSLGQESEALKW